MVQLTAIIVREITQRHKYRWLQINHSDYTMFQYWARLDSNSTS